MLVLRSTLEMPLRHFFQGAMHLFLCLCVCLYLSVYLLMFELSMKFCVDFVPLSEASGVILILLV